MERANRGDPTDLRLLALLGQRQLRAALANRMEPRPRPRVEQGADHPCCHRREAGVGEHVTEAPWHEVVVDGQDDEATCNERKRCPKSVSRVRRVHCLQPTSPVLTYDTRRQHHGKDNENAPTDMQE